MAGEKDDKGYTVIDAEVMGGAPQGTAMDLVSAGSALVRLENTTQMQVAIQRPRNEDKILAAAKAELERYPSMADEAIYSKPAGKNKEGKDVYVEGLSIRAAESLANRWANSAYGCEITGEDDNAIYLAAIFMDYENNTRHVIQRRVSKTYKKAQSTTIVPYSPDRLDMKVGAETSKGLREVILRSIATGLKKEYEHHAYKVLEMQPLDQRRLAIVARFKEVGVKKDAIEKKMEKKIEELSQDDLKILSGLLNAIREGEVSATEALSVEEKKDEGLEKKGTEGVKEKIKGAQEADKSTSGDKSTGEPAKPDQGKAEPVKEASETGAGAPQGADPGEPEATSGSAPPIDPGGAGEPPKGPIISEMEKKAMTAMTEAIGNRQLDKAWTGNVPADLKAKDPEAYKRLADHYNARLQSFKAK
jgi:hypothetical protein